MPSFPSGALEDGAQNIFSPVAWAGPKWWRETTWASKPWWENIWGLVIESPRKNAGKSWKNGDLTNDGRSFICSSPPGWDYYLNNVSMIHESPDLKEMNYANIAREMTARGIRVKDPKDLARTLRDGVSEPSCPTVIVVVVTRDPSQMLPAVDVRTQVKIKAGDQPV